MQVHAVVHAPAEVLVEGPGVDENVGHVRDAVDRPITDVLVKPAAYEHAGAEHVAHRRDAGGVPRADVVVEATGVEQKLHVPHPASLPRGDVAIRRLGDHPV